MESHDLIIFHLDLDCFYAAVERLDHPDYNNKPLIVGADPKEGNGRGVVLTSSYEARKYGIRSGMAISIAYNLCPHAIYAKPHFSRYEEISDRVMYIVEQYCPHIERMGMDETYFNMTEHVADFVQAQSIAEKIKAQVFFEVGVTCSIGVSFTRTLAKIASDYNKPNGICILTKQNFKAKLAPLKINSLPGIGKKTKHFYEDKGIKTIGDLVQLPLFRVIELFGKGGEWAWKVANGYANSVIYDGSHEYHRKSMSEERTFFEDTNDPKVIVNTIEKMNDALHEQLESSHIFYRTVSLKIRFQGFITFTRSKSLLSPLRNKEKALETILELLEEFSQNPKKIRLVGVRFSNLEGKCFEQTKDLMAYI